MTYIILFLTVFVMAAVNTAIGSAGGVVFVTMAIVLPVPAVVPVHAAQQAGGSLIRFSLLRRLADYTTLRSFAVGGLVGFIPAAVLASSIDPDPDWLRLGLGVATLLPMLARTGSAPLGRGRTGLSALMLGAWTSFLTLFVGATGALVGSVLDRLHPDQRQRVATQAGCMGLQHTAKIAVFSALGFSFAPYLPLIGGLLVASAIGAWLGKRILVSSSNTALRAVFEIVVLGLGTYLCVRSALTILLRGSS